MRPLDAVRHERPPPGVIREPTNRKYPPLANSLSCVFYTDTDGVIFTIPGTSATLIRRRSDSLDGLLDAGRRENMRFYSANCFRTHPGSAIGTQSPGFPDFSDFLLSHYLLVRALIVTAYEL